MVHALDHITPLTWRRTSSEDLPALAELLDAIAYIDGLSAPMDAAEASQMLLHAEGRSDCELLIGLDSDVPVGIAWLVGHDLTATNGDAPSWRARLVSELHPAYRHQQIGRKALEWLMQAARETFLNAHQHAEATMDLQVLVDDRWQRRMFSLTDLGLKPLRWFVDMHTEFDVDGTAVPALDGIEIRPFSADLADEVRQTHNAAFATRELSRPIGPVQWYESLSRVDSRPEWSWVAVAEGQVVGYALNSVVEWAPDEAEGWTDRLGTLPDWRGFGIARTLLLASLASFEKAGMVGGGLGVDSEVGPEGLGLYRSIGYESSEIIVQFGRTETVAEALHLL